MKKSTIVLVGCNSPCFPSHKATATMSVDGVWYDYTGFPFQQFLILDINKPGEMLNWLKTNSESVHKINYHN